MDKEKYLQNNFEKYSKKLKIKYKIETRKDRRLKKHTASVFEELKNNKIVYVVSYNPDKIEQLTKAELLHVIFHELGHIKLKHHSKYYIYNNVTQERAEYEAGIFALRTIKKYESKYYNSSMTIVKRTSKLLDAPAHSRAYKKILKKLRGK